MGGEGLCEAELKMVMILAVREGKKGGDTEGRGRGSFVCWGGEVIRECGLQSTPDNRTFPPRPGSE